MKTLGPLTSGESAQLEAALVLLRRGELPLAARVLNPERDADLSKDIQAYIAAHSPSGEVTVCGKEQEPAEADFREAELRRTGWVRWMWFWWKSPRGVAPLSTDEAWKFASILDGVENPPAP